MKSRPQTTSQRRTRRRGFSFTEVLFAVKQDPDLKRIPVLIYTSSMSESDVNKAYEFGANSYVRKPRELDDLYDIIRTLEHFWIDLALLPSTSPA